jgi:hypothetical protein
LEQQSGAFVTMTTFGLATSGQRKVTRQTINKVLSPTLRIALEFNAGLIEIKPSLFDFDGLG